jgi:MraZ protein
VIKTGFTGEYEHNLDEKGRVSLPAKIKKYIEEAADGEELAGKIVLTKSTTRKCLEAFMVDDWQRMVASYNQNMNLKENKVDDSIVDVGRNTDTVTLDKAGRIMINGKLKEFAEIKKKVVFIGAIDRVLIWSSELLAEYDKGRQ